MLHLSISNIAWDTTDDDTVAGILAAHGVHHIDMAPGKYFPRPEEASEADIAAVHTSWQERGFAIAGFQSLLFGTQGLNIFAAADVQEQMLRRLHHICRIAAGLGARKLVFGSPKNRDRSGLSDQQTADVAHTFFTRLGNIAQSFDVEICLESNPEEYGANFLTTTLDACAFVAALGHPAIRLQLDTGTMFLNSEPAEVIGTVWPHVGHVHVSEPRLTALGQGKVDHARLGYALKQTCANQVSMAGTAAAAGPSCITIEMLRRQGEPLEMSLVQAIELVRRHYL